MSLALAARDLIRGILERRGWQARRLADAHFLRVHEVDCVFDVGANRGQFAAALRRRGYRGRIVSLEPLAGPFAELANAASGDPLWSVRNCAAGAAPGEAEIAVAELDVFSSFKPVSAVGSDYDPRSRTVARQRVPVVTLDTLAANFPCERPFLKIDTQGFEREVLAGAAGLLERAEGLLLELPVENLYDGVWTFGEAIAHLDALGFQPAHFDPVCPVPGDPASAMELDALFRRKRG